MGFYPPVILFVVIYYPNFLSLSIVRIAKAFEKRCSRINEQPIEPNSVLESEKESLCFVNTRKEKTLDLSVSRPIVNHVRFCYDLRSSIEKGSKICAVLGIRGYAEQLWCNGKLNIIRESNWFLMTRHGFGLREGKIMGAGFERNLLSTWYAVLIRGVDETGEFFSSTIPTIVERDS